MKKIILKKSDKNSSKLVKVRVFLQKIHKLLTSSMNFFFLDIDNPFENLAYRFLPSIEGKRYFIR